MCVFRKLSVYSFFLQWEIYKIEFLSEEPKKVYKWKEIRKFVNENNERKCCSIWRVKYLNLIIYIYLLFIMLNFSRVAGLIKCYFCFLKNYLCTIKIVERHNKRLRQHIGKENVLQFYLVFNIIFFLIFFVLFFFIIKIQYWWRFIFESFPILFVTASCSYYFKSFLPTCCLAHFTLKFFFSIILILFY